MQDVLAWPESGMAERMYGWPHVMFIYIVHSALHSDKTCWLVCTLYDVTWYMTMNNWLGPITMSQSV